MKSDDGIYAQKSTHNALPITLDEHEGVRLFNDGIELHVFKLCDYAAVAAPSLDEATDWYKDITGLDDWDLYAEEDVNTIPYSDSIYADENKKQTITIREILEKYWKGEPFIAVSYIEPA